MRGHPRRSYKLTFALLALPAIAYALLQSLVVPALADIQHTLHTSVNSVSWVLTGYLISAAVATPLIGRLGDIYGKKRRPHLGSRRDVGGGDVGASCNALLGGREIRAGDSGGVIRSRSGSSATSSRMSGLPGGSA